MKTRLLCLVFLAFGLSGLAGCLSHGTLGGVAVTIDSIKPAAAPAADNQAVLTLHIANENVVAVGIASSTHRLFLNGTFVGTAICATPVGVQTLSAATQDASLRFDNPALVRQLANAPGAKTAGYRLESNLTVTAGDDTIHVKSVYEGTLDLGPLVGAR
jgi:LEA14-like dessication related protein